MESEEISGTFSATDGLLAFLETTGVIPPFPGPDVIPLVARPSPRLLVTDDEEEIISILAMAYREAIRVVFRKDTQALLSKKSRDGYKNREALLDASVSLKYHQLPPASWAVFRAHQWFYRPGRLAQGRDRMRTGIPGITWIYRIEAIERFRGWCRTEMAYTMSSMFPTVKHRDLVTRWMNMKAEVMKTIAEHRDVDELLQPLIEKAVNRTLPRDLYVMLVQSCIAEQEKVQRSVNRSAAQGTWIW